MAEPRGTDDDAGQRLEHAVLERYTKASRQREAALCCPSRYDPRYLDVIPREILERDYGCGDPSRHARRGDAVLDLGSGGGKIAYILSQVVGPGGSVIGVDFNDEMLALARRHQRAVGDRIGWHNVRFLEGRIQDLSPLIPEASIDLVVSNCVLNLVRRDHRAELFEGVFRVLRDGGRVAISDIVSDSTVPESIAEEPELWSGCIAGAFEETEFLRAFEKVGFRQVGVSERAEEPFAVHEGVVFRSVTVTGRKHLDAGTAPEEDPANAPAGGSCCPSR